MRPVYFTARDSSVPVPLRMVLLGLLADEPLEGGANLRRRDAVAALHAAPLACDAVVTDFRLQGFSGVELLKQVKLLRPELPVVVISGYVDEVLKSAAYGAGAALVVSKNHDLNELCVALRELLGEAPNPSMTTYSEWAKI